MGMLYDTHGIVWEWCSDWFDEKYFETCPIKNPTGPECGYRHTRPAVQLQTLAIKALVICEGMRGEASSCDSPSPKVPAFDRFELLGVLA
jgi:hypothetical protein